MRLAAHMPHESHKNMSAPPAQNLQIVVLFLMSFNSPLGWTEDSSSWFFINIVACHGWPFTPSHVVACSALSITRQRGAPPKAASKELGTTRQCGAPSHKGSYGELKHRGALSWALTASWAMGECIGSSKGGVHPL